MSRSHDFSSPFFDGLAFPPAINSVRTFRDRDGYRVQETVRTTRTPVFSEPTSFSRIEAIRSPPISRVESASKGAGPGIVTSSSEYSTDANGRPSHYSSTVYKSPYGKTYRFNSHF